MRAHVEGTRHSCWLLMTTEEPITLSDQIACIRREIGIRKRVYSRWVAIGKMKQVQADYEILCMQSVLDTLIGIQKGGPKDG